MIIQKSGKRKKTNAEPNPSTVPMFARIAPRLTGSAAAVRARCPPCGWVTGWGVFWASVVATRVFLLRLLGFQPVQHANEQIGEGDNHNQHDIAEGRAFAGVEIAEGPLIEIN